MKLCGIYSIYNYQNGKIYIGKSTDILKRWEQHIDAARLQKLDYDFYKDLIYLSSFHFQVLELCKQEELQEKEQYYISKFNSLEQGYNQVMAIDATKEESLMLDRKILWIIDLLKNTNLSYSQIAEKVGISENTIANINRCKSYTDYHNYVSNIREESGHKQRNDKGELNPNSKLTEQEALQIIELLKNTTMTAKEIGDKFGVSAKTVGNINLRKRWTHLTTGFNKNVRKEFKNETIR